MLICFFYSLEANPNISGKDSTASVSSTTSTGSDESISSTESLDLDLEGDVCLSDSSLSSYTELHTPRVSSSNDNT